MRLWNKLTIVTGLLQKQDHLYRIINHIGKNIDNNLIVIYQSWLTSSQQQYINEQLYVSAPSHEHVQLTIDILFSTPIFCRYRR